MGARATRIDFKGFFDFVGECGSFGIELKFGVFPQATEVL